MIKLSDNQLYRAYMLKEKLIGRCIKQDYIAIILLFKPATN